MTVCVQAAKACLRAHALCAGTTAVDTVTVETLTRYLDGRRPRANRARPAATDRRARDIGHIAGLPTAIRRASVVPPAAARAARWGSMTVHGSRSIRGPDGVEWSVREVDTHDRPGARGDRCLIFGGPTLIRRVWTYPAQWAVLPDASLLALADLDRRH